MVCGDLIAKHFSPTKNTGHIAQLVVDFLATPNMDHFVDVEAANEIATDVKTYEAKAAKAAKS